MNRKQRRADKKRAPAAAREPTADVRELLAEAIRHHHAGKLQEAEALYRQILRSEPRQTDCLHLLGVIAHQVGRKEDAVALISSAIAVDQNQPVYHCNLANSLKGLGRFDDAVAAYQAALRIRPDYAEAHSNLGNLLYRLGRIEDAAGAYAAALRARPYFAEAHSNLGNALCDLARPEQGIAAYRRALSLKPDYADALSNMAFALTDLGRADQALAVCAAALRLKADYAEAHTNLANALYHQGRLAAAAAAYGAALCLKPDSALNLTNFAALRLELGDLDSALRCVIRSLQIGETAAAKRLFIACAQPARWQTDDEVIRTALVRGLTEPWGRPGKLAPSACNFIKMAQKPDAAIADDPLLCALLTSTPVCDLALERGLTMARRTMLDAAERTLQGEAGQPVSAFQAALARQCFINEYVFFGTDEEFRKAAALRDALVAALSSDEPIAALWPVAVACYFRLDSLPFAERLLSRQWHGVVDEVLTQQIREPAQERQLLASLGRIGDIDDAVSLRVQSQYEENPYPRWVRAAPPDKALPVDAALRRIFPQAPFQPLGKQHDLDVLIAGCGTGQHSITAALRFSGARILAVDLSKASLCYAKRKSIELGLTSIDYAQADLLRLGALGRSFDVIESSGVLHHLAEPLVGWQVLLSLLRPGGVMNLGFYSEVARRSIVMARALIAEQGYGSSADEIRRFRQDLQTRDALSALRPVMKFSDFYSVSECRDMLFHVQEHRMTLKTINEFLMNNNLRFIGFEIEKSVINAYHHRFGNDPAAIDLAQWEIFESENPDTFSAMYQFWIQKADHSAEQG